MQMSFFIGPLVGGIIGYITNGIAIKMLFRPLKPIYIAGKRVPFTPGIIPKERDRIARVIGQVVGTELINQETLKENLLSQEMYVKLERTINEWFIVQKNSQKTIRTLLGGLVDEIAVETLTYEAKDQITEKAYAKILEMDLGNLLADRATKELKGNLGMLSMFITDNMIDMAKGKIETIINEMLEEKAKESIWQVVDAEGDQLLDTPLCSIAGRLEEQLPKIKYMLLKQYTHIIENQLGDILNTVNIEEIVEQKIKALDMLELEKMILHIMSKELNAIIWLGALLGTLMGFVLNFFK